ncbi:GNAT family N-acetyltransferase [Thalassotalea agariperforans]
MSTQIKAKYPVKLAAKSDKKSVKRFYKSQHYSASFIGFDSTYIVLDNEQIIASAIVSYSTSDNNQALLHALVVAKLYQKQGIATELINIIKQQHCHNYREKHSTIVCFADDKLSQFYQRMSFKVVSSKSKSDNTQCQSYDNDLTVKRVLSESNFNRFIAYQKNTPSLLPFLYN